MQLLTVDTVTRRWLLDRSMPIHFYAEGLFHATTCLRELAKDTLKLVNTVNLPVDDTGAVNLPDDFMDDVALAIQAGVELQRIPHKSSLNPIRRHSATTGLFVPQTNVENEVTVDGGLFFGSTAWAWFWNVNDYGEFTGRYFGASGGTGLGYEVIMQRRQIQLTAGFEGGGIILQYISNGQSIDNATQIDWRAHRAITTYIDWQKSPNATNLMSPEARTYYNERKLLRSSMSDLTVTDIKNVIRSGYTAAVKN